MSDLQDDIELKKRIEIWKDQKRKGIKTDEEIREEELNKKNAQEKDVPMDPV